MLSFSFVLQDSNRQDMIDMVQTRALNNYTLQALNKQKNIEVVEAKKLNNDTIFVKKIKLNNGYMSGVKISKNGASILLSIDLIHTETSLSLINLAPDFSAISVQVINIKDKIKDELAILPYQEEKGNLINYEPEDIEKFINDIEKKHKGRVWYFTDLVAICVFIFNNFDLRLSQASSVNNSNRLFQDAKSTPEPGKTNSANQASTAPKGPN